MKKKFIYFFLAVFLITKSSAFAISYKDISQSHWAYKYITTLTTNKVINGYEDGTFRPDGTITNAEFIKLVVMAALPNWIDINDAESNFEHWASKYVWIAERYGLIKTGSIDLSNIDNSITRIEMVRIIVKADLTMKGNKLETSEKVKFKDVISLNSDDLLLLKHACSRNLITGYSDNTFRPHSNMTRAEAATMIYRFK